MIGLIAIAILLGGMPGAAPEILCNRISEIKSFPMKGRGTDEVYRGLIEAGDAAVPCLIEKIADTTAMTDPRMAPTYSGIVVGDIAFFILARILGIEGDEMLPEDVGAKYTQEGVYAYFGYVSKPPHRLELQSRCRKWWEDSAGQA